MNENQPQRPDFTGGDLPQHNPSNSRGFQQPHPRVIPPTFQPPEKKGGKAKKIAIAALLLVGGCTFGNAMGSDSSDVSAPATAPTVTVTATTTAQPTNTTEKATPASQESAQPSQEPSAIEEPPAPKEWADGTYEIGTGKDIKPGTYRVKVTDDIVGMCYVEQTKDRSGELGSILSNDIIEGPGYVTITPKANYLKVSGCLLTPKA